MVQGREEVWKVSLLQANPVPANAATPATSISVYTASTSCLLWNIAGKFYNPPNLLS